MSALLPNLCQVGFKLEFADSNQFFVSSTANVRPQLHIKGNLNHPSDPPLASPNALLAGTLTLQPALRLLRPGLRPPIKSPQNLTPGLQTTLAGPQVLRADQQSLRV